LRQDIHRTTRQRDSAAQLGGHRVALPGSASQILSSPRHIRCFCGHYYWDPIMLGCLVDVGVTGAIAGHLTDLWYWEAAASGAIWVVGANWLVNHFVDWVQAQFRGTTPPR
jgi:hypothetical protein